MSTFSDRLTSIRKHQRLTQDGLAKICGTSGANISFYENGQRTPNIKNIIMLAKGLGVTSDYLIGIDEKNILPGKLLGLNFGDIIDDGWQSKDKPTRKGVYIKRELDHLLCTNMKGDFYQLINNENSKLKVIGTIFVTDELLDFYEFRESFKD